MGTRRWGRTIKGRFQDFHLGQILIREKGHWRLANSNDPIEETWVVFTDTEIKQNTISSNDVLWE